MKLPSSLTMTPLVLVSRSRRPKFELTLKIIDLNNVPLVTGTSSIKWHLPSSTSAEHRGRTTKELIKNHAVTWNYSITLPVRLAIDKSNNLLETDLQFEVLQEYSSGGGRAEKITLGSLSLNLAEYVEGIDDSDQGIVRRYLMQDSKINSTLKIGICMKQIDGERGFVAPVLKTAPVFGGIAGILGQEQGDGEDPGHMPSVNRGRETGELQDMYRKSLAAYWAAQAGELPADECIEDLFSGGDGWGNKHAKETSPHARQTLHPAYHLDGESHGRESRLHDGERHYHRHESKRSRSSAHSIGHGLNHKWDDRDRDAARRFIRSGIGAKDEENDFISQAAHHSVFANMRNEYNEKHERKRGFRQAREVNEFSKRDDLVAWKLPGVSRETEESVNKV